jgi:hypothetical protein
LAGRPGRQPPHRARPTARRPDIGTLSPSSPRPTSRPDMWVIVGTSGRGAPPTAHSDACGRKTLPPTEHDHGSRPDRPAVILYGRPKIHTRDHGGTACISCTLRVGSSMASGLPTTRTSCSTPLTIFPLGGDREVHPHWPRGAEHFSILLEEVERLPDNARVCKVGFLAPDLAQPFVHPGADVLVMEGPRIVGNAVIREVCDAR